MATAAKTGRMEVRINPAAKAQLQEAARITNQDLSSFILEAATTRARNILLEDKLIRFSDADLEQLEAALSAADEPDPALVAMFRQHS